MDNTQIAITHSELKLNLDKAIKYYENKREKYLQDLYSQAILEHNKYVDSWLGKVFTLGKGKWITSKKEALDVLDEEILEKIEYLHTFSCAYPLERLNKLKSILVVKKIQEDANHLKIVYEPTEDRYVYLSLEDYNILHVHSLSSE
jgi:hypothetical protein